MTAEALAEAPVSKKTAGPLGDQGGVSLERLPGLAIVFEQFASSLMDRLSPLTRAAAVCKLKKTELANLFEVLALGKGNIAGVLHCEELDARCVVLFDHSFVAGLANASFGGDALESPPLPADRKLTKIEFNLVEKASRAAASALEGAFNGFTEAPFQFERQETIVDTMLLGRRDIPVVNAQIGFTALGVEGSIQLLLPQSTLTPIRQKLARDPVEEAPHIDPRWAKQMKTGLSLTQMSVKGVLEDLEMTLGEIAELTVGHVLTLRGAGMGRVRLECGGHDLFWCKLGQAEDQYTLEIEEPYRAEPDVVLDMLER